MARNVRDVHTELMHYTTAAGLHGILTSGCLWATNYRFLNDSKEISLFFERRLPEIVRNIFHDHHKSDSDVDHFVSSLKEATFEVNDPYIFSMCGPADEISRKNGILSQWRAYGSDGGYAVVFDSEKLENLFRLESNKYLYQQCHWGDVCYHGVSANLQPHIDHIDEYEDIIRKVVPKILSSSYFGSGEYYDAVTFLSCLYKHWGFFEEKEVRFVALPMIKEEVISAVRSRGDDRPAKVVNFFSRNAIPVPYINLFDAIAAENTDRKLPISRIIIGPHREASLRKEAVERLLFSTGYGVSADISEIPYVGR